MLPNWYNKYKNLIDNSVLDYLEGYFSTEDNLGLDKLKEAVIYSCNGGKRIRSVLAIQFYLQISGSLFNDLNKNNDIIRFCLALEYLHAYSLIHDDLPSMDNDEYRRGKLTTWKKYGESTAVLAGDLLNSLAFELLAEVGNIPLIKAFGKAVGLKGMIGGQTLDLYYEDNIEKLNLESLEEIHNKKTGALIKVSILGGLILGNLTLEEDKKYKKEELGKYIEFGKKIGLAFQVRDDINELYDKGVDRVGEEKKGFIYFMGEEKSIKYLNDLITDSKELIKDLKSEKLDFLVDYIGSYKK